MKSSTIKITLFVLLSLILQASCSSHPLHLRSRPLMNASASLDKEITIYRDQDGFYINADLDSSSQPSEKPNNNTVKMILSLYNNNILLLNSCFNSQSYPCSYYQCTEYPHFTANITYSNFIASTIQASAFVYLDYQNWQLQEKALLATSCSTSGSKSFGSGRYGILGLGTQGDSKNNFIQDTVFSIYLDSDLQGGFLKFANDQNYSSSWVGNITTVDANWVVNIQYGYIQIGSDYSEFSGNLVFDINADVLGLPLIYFHTIFYIFPDALSSKHVTCSHDTYLPTCNYTGYIKDLPDIWLWTGNWGVRMNIPAEIYVKNAKSRDDYVTSITLNMKAIDPSLSGDCYVTPEYANTIIMDARTMSPFYLVFSQQSQEDGEGLRVIQVNQAKSNAHHRPQPDPQPQDPPNQWWIYAIIGAVVFVALGGCCCLVIKKRNAGKSVNVGVSVVQTTQAPLLSEENSVIAGYNHQINKTKNLN